VPSTPSAPAVKVPAARAGTDFAFARGAANADLKTWQAQMAKRGWDIRADGVFGPQTQRVLTSFQAEKRLSVDGLLGPQSWTAAWTAAVT
jgi:peptidoglycan hydrolase-like protein with peptidoglycan-binding domain